MAEKIELNAGDILTPIVIKDKRGTTVGSALINLTDIRIPARVAEVLDYMKSIPVDGADYDALLEFDAMLQDKICRVFGYDCSKSLFGILSPTSRCGGKYMAVLIVQKILDAVPKETKEKAAVRMEKIARHTQRYEK